MFSIDTLENDIDDMNYMELIRTANRFGIAHNSESWLDDDFPDNLDLLRVEIFRVLYKRLKGVINEHKTKTSV